jgi:hypothetical protein
MGLKQQKDANFNTSMQSSHQNPDPKSQPNDTQKKRQRELTVSKNIRGTDSSFDSDLQNHFLRERLQRKVYEAERGVCRRR